MARIDNRGNLRGSLQNQGGAIDRARGTKGANDFLALSKALKSAGQIELRKELHKVVRDTAKPLIPKVREAARRSLPRQGGLNERIARKSYRAQARTGERTAGVRIVGTKVDPRINEGRIFHPVFGRRLPIKPQIVPAARGYFDETLSREGPAVRDDILRTLSDFTDRIVNEARRR